MEHGQQLPSSYFPVFYFIFILNKILKNDVNV